MINYLSLFLQGLKIILIQMDLHTQYIVFKFILLYTCMPLYYAFIVCIYYVKYAYLAMFDTTDVVFGILKLRIELLVLDRRYIIYRCPSRWDKYKKSRVLFLIMHKKNLCKTATLKKTQNGFKDQLSLNEGQNYCGIGAFCNTFDLH